MYEEERSTGLHQIALLVTGVICDLFLVVCLRNWGSFGRRMLAPGSVQAIVTGIGALAGLSFSLAFLLSIFLGNVTGRFFLLRILLAILNIIGFAAMGAFG